MPKTILLTGGNRGLGFATASRLLRAGHRLVITTRTASARNDAVKRLRAVASDASVEGYVVDLASQTSVRAVAKEILAAGHQFDVLHHNAGVLMPPETRTLTDDGLEVTLQVNAVAPMALTMLLRPALNESARITAVGSSLHMPSGRGVQVDFSFDDPNLEQRYGSRLAYKNSKLALMWIMAELDRRLAPGHRADVISPGFIPTTAAAQLRGLKKFVMGVVMPRTPVATSLDSAAASVAYLLGSSALGGPDDGGRYFRDGVPAQPSEDAQDSDLAKRFWDYAADAIGQG
ncbi:MAG: SDR family NAD(P)-dependent oxidoreductase [Myxococcota bacterium]